MRLPREIQLPELMGIITRTAPEVHIRLALTPDSSSPAHSPQWVARSLVVDVYPAVWANRRSEGPLAEYKPPQKLYDYSGLALFYLGYLRSDVLVHWFAHPEDCRLTGHNTRPGYGSEVRHFLLPEVNETAQGQRVYSGQNDSFARLPWPRTFFEFRFKDPNSGHSNDQQELYAPDLRHFDNFREARGRLIYDLKDLRNFQDRDQVVIRMVDADGWIRQAHQKRRAISVSINGLRIHPAQVMVKGTGLDDDDPGTRQTVLGGGTVHFTLQEDPPTDLRVILANEESGVVWCSYGCSSWWWWLLEFWVVVCGVVVGCRYL